MIAYSLQAVPVAQIPALPLSQFFPDAASQARVDCTCYTWVISGEGRTILVDSGPDIAWARARGLSAELLSGRTCSDALRAAGVDLAEVHAVILTHLHYDHCQNLDLFPNATLYLQAGELVAARAGGRFFIDAEDFFNRYGPRTVLVDGDAEPWPGIQLILSGGHTEGHQSVLLGPTPLVAVCGDIVPHRGNEQVPAPNNPAQREVRAFLDRMRGLGATLLPSHDPMLLHEWTMPIEINITE